VESKKFAAVVLIPLILLAAFLAFAPFLLVGGSSSDGSSASTWCTLSSKDTCPDDLRSALLKAAASVLVITAIGFPAIAALHSRARGQARSSRKGTFVASGFLIFFGMVGVFGPGLWNSSGGGSTIAGECPPVAFSVDPYKESSDLSNLNSGVLFRCHPNQRLFGGIGVFTAGVVLALVAANSGTAASFSPGMQGSSRSLQGPPAFSQLPVANWYPDPDNPSGMRYWDGVQWTDQRTVARAQGPQSQAVPNQPYPGQGPEKGPVSGQSWWT